MTPSSLWEKYGLQHPAGPGTNGHADTIPHVLDPEVTRKALTAAPREMAEEFIFTGSAADIYAKLEPYCVAGAEHIVLADSTNLVQDAEALPEIMPQLGLLIDMLKKQNR